jgi:hypothetical protein
MSQQIALGGLMIALPIYLQMVLEYNAMLSGLSIAPLSLSMFGVALLAGKRAGKRRPSAVIRFGFALLSLGLIVLIPIVPRADSGWWLTIPLLIAGSGLGLLVSQLNNYTLAPISEERVSEAAGVNSAAGSFGLSFGLAFAGAIMLATLSFAFTNLAEDSAVLSPAEQQRVSTALEDDAELLSNTQLEEVLVGQPPDVQAEIIRINTDAPAARAADRAPRAAPGRPGGAVQRVPDAAAARARTIRLGRGHVLRLTSAQIGRRLDSARTSRTKTIATPIDASQSTPSVSPKNAPASHPPSTAPRIPITSVPKKPIVFRPGTSSSASTPTISPTTTYPRIEPMSVSSRIASPFAAIRGRDVSASTAASGFIPPPPCPMDVPAPARRQSAPPAEPKAWARARVGTRHPTMTRPT